MNTTFKKFIDHLSDDPTAFKQYADACNTTPGYIDAHLKYARKIPRPELFTALIVHSNNAVTREDLIEHFYPQPIAVNE